MRPGCTVTTAPCLGDMHGVDTRRPARAPHREREFHRLLQRHRRALRPRDGERRRLHGRLQRRDALLEVGRKVVAKRVAAGGAQHGAPVVSSRSHRRRSASQDGTQREADKRRPGDRIAFFTNHLRRRRFCGCVTYSIWAAQRSRRRGGSMRNTWSARRSGRMIVTSSIWISCGSTGRPARRKNVAGVRQNSAFIERSRMS